MNGGFLPVFKVKNPTNNSTIISIDKIRVEIYQHNDQLKQWCKNNLPSDFLKHLSVQFLNTVA
ncbi:MAG: DUF4411 family protein [Flavobacteriales bacterium]